MKYLIHILYNVYDLLVLALLRNRIVHIGSGPFKGMIYHCESVGSSLVPKILGTYESETYEYIENFPEFDLGLDIGAAEGYYAVGLLYKKVCKMMIAWELTEGGMELCKKNYKINGGIDRLEVRGECTNQELKEVLCSNGDKKILMIMDCEGYESVLLSGIPKEYLNNVYFLIETHDFIKSGIHADLHKEFLKTHNLTEIFPKKKLYNRDQAKLTWPLDLLGSRILWRLSTSERRAKGNAWLLGTPRTEF